MLILSWPYLEIICEKICWKIFDILILLNYYTFIILQLNINFTF